MSSPRAGDKIGKYELVHPVGEGGMGEVWVARFRSLGGFESRVAIKVIHARYASEKRFRDMFLDEARVSALISHPHVVSTFDLGVEGEMLYQVMEYVDGDSLAGLHQGMLERQERMPLPVALRIASDVCAGLHAAHELQLPDGQAHSLVHRDVSPQNILVGANGAVKLIDFGVALMQNRLAQDSHGSLKGKLRYMPPEQARGDKVDRRADVYAVGAVLYELLCGRLPFDDSTEVVYLRALLAGEPPRAIPDEVPEEVRAIVLRAMATDREDRYPTAQALRDDLEAVLRKRPANIGSFVEIYMSPRARARREAIRSGSQGGFDGDSHLPSSLLESRADSKADGSMLSSSLLQSRAETPAPISPAATTASDPPAGAPDLAPRRSKREAPSSRAPVTSARSAALRPGPAISADPFDDTADVDPPSSGTTESHLTLEAARGVIPAAVGRHIPTEDPPQRSRSPQRIAITIGLLAAFVGILALVLPGIVQKRIIARAEALGIRLTIERTTLTLQGIELKGVRASSAGLPFKSASARDVRVPSYFRSEVVARGLELELEGSLKDVSASAMQYMALHPAAASSPVRVDASEVTLAWSGVLGPSTRLEATSGSFGFGTGEPPILTLIDVKAFSPALTLTTSRGVLGPFTLNVDESDERVRTRVVFEPGKSDGPNIFVVAGRSAPTHFSLKIPRRRVSELRIPAAFLGLSQGEDPELAINGAATLESDGHIHGEGTVDVFSVGLGRSKTRSDLAMHLVFGGEPDKPVDLVNSTLVYGPFTADLTGKIAYDRGLRGDVLWKAKPMPCASLARAEARQKLGAAAPVLDALFGNAVRVTGNVNVQGTYRFDLSELEKASLTFQTRDTCGVSLFPPP